VGLGKGQSLSPLLSNCQITGLEDLRWGLIAAIITEKAVLLLCRRLNEKYFKLFIFLYC
jgi:hypothetical protein